MFKGKSGNIGYSVRYLYLLFCFGLGLVCFFFSLSKSIWSLLLLVKFSLTFQFLEKEVEVGLLLLNLVSFRSRAVCMKCMSSVNQSFSLMSVSGSGGDV